MLSQEFINTLNNSLHVCCQLDLYHWYFSSGTDVKTIQTCQNFFFFCLVQLRLFFLGSRWYIFVLIPNWYVSFNKWLLIIKVIWTIFSHKHRKLSLLCLG